MLLSRECGTLGLAGISMGVISLARPDLAAHREATTAPFPRLVGDLVAVIGKKLTAYIAGVKDVRAIDRWMDEAVPYKSAEERLRFAFRVVKTIENQEKWVSSPVLAYGTQPRVERPRSDPTLTGGRPRNCRP